MMGLESVRKGSTMNLRDVLRFRSDAHKAWFWATVLVFLLVFLVFKSRLEEAAIALAVVCVLFHTLTSVGAVYQTRKSGNDRLFSTDCIWFNALVALGYGLFAAYMYNMLLLLNPSP